MEGKHVRRVPLIVESEWDRKGLMDDFPKLVVGRAEHRVMIFQAPNDETKEQDLEMFRDEIEGNSLKQSGVRFLFACGNWREKAFQFDQHVVA